MSCSITVSIPAREAFVYEIRISRGLRHQAGELISRVHTPCRVLLLTDDANGDAIFMEDIYSFLPDSVSEQRSRISQIDEIRAGAGDDIIDLTSSSFAFEGEGIVISGGAGNDTIWANNGSNTLCGDAGDDRLVGGADSDVISGGTGNDSLHGGGGDDIFTFCADWGTDTVEQLAEGSVTLWFESGTLENWDKETLTYTCSGNSITVTGVTADRVTLLFGDDGSAQYADIVSAGAFKGSTSEKIFEEQSLLA